MSSMDRLRDGVEDPPSKDNPATKLPDAGSAGIGSHLGMIIVLSVTGALLLGLLAWSTRCFRRRPCSECLEASAARKRAREMREARAAFVSDWYTYSSPTAMPIGESMSGSTLVGEPTRMLPEPVYTCDYDIGSEDAIYVVTMPRSYNPVIDKLALPPHKDTAVAYAPQSPRTITPEELSGMKSPGAWRFTSSTKAVRVDDDSGTLLSFSGSKDSINTILTSLPAPSLQLANDALVREVLYYEVTLIDRDANATVVCGLATQHLPATLLPGRHTSSVGLHSDTGHVFTHGSNTGIAYSDPWRRDDVIGVGLVTATNQVFFTHNGTRLPNVPAFAMPIHLPAYPAIGAHGNCTLHVNFGVNEFRWAEANERRWMYALGQPTPSPPSSPSL
ncbi:Protein ssh4 [Sorochytrium milnesiophthora]